MVVAYAIAQPMGFFSVIARLQRSRGRLGSPRFLFSCKNSEGDLKRIFMRLLRPSLSGWLAMTGGISEYKHTTPNAARKFGNTKRPESHRPMTAIPPKK